MRTDKDVLNKNITDPTSVETYNSELYWYKACVELKQDPNAKWEETINPIFKVLERFESKKFVWEAFSAPSFFEFFYLLKNNGKLDKIANLIARIHEFAQKNVNKDKYFLIINLKLVKLYISSLNDLPSAFKTINAILDHPKAIDQIPDSQKILDDLVEYAELLAVRNEILIPVKLIKMTLNYLSVTNYAQIYRIITLVGVLYNNDDLSAVSEGELLAAIANFLVRLEGRPLKFSFFYFKHLLFYSYISAPWQELFFLMANHFEKAINALTSVQDENYPKDIDFYKTLARNYKNYVQPHKARRYLKIALSVASLNIEESLVFLRDIYSALQAITAKTTQHHHLFSLASTAFDNKSAEVAITYVTLLDLAKETMDHSFLMDLQVFYKLLEHAFSKCEEKSLVKIINPNLFNAIKKGNIVLQNLIAKIPDISLRELAENSPSTTVALVVEYANLTNKNDEQTKEIAELKALLQGNAEKLTQQEEEIAFLKGKIMNLKVNSPENSSSTSTTPRMFGN